MGNSAINKASYQQAELEKELNEPILASDKKNLDPSVLNQDEAKVESLENDKRPSIPEEELSLRKAKTAFNKKMAQRKKKTTSELCKWDPILLGKIMSMAVTPNNRYLISGTEEGKVFLINLQSKRLINSFVFEQSPIWSISVSEDNNHFVFTEGGQIRLYNLQTQQELCSLSHQGARAAAISKKNTFIVSAGDDKSIRVFSLESRKEVKYFENIHQDIINTIVLSKDDKYIFSGSSDGSIKVTDLALGSLVHHFEHVHISAIRSIAVSEDNKWMISTSEDKSIKIFNIQTMGEVHHIKDAHEGAQINSVTISRNNKFFASGADDGSIKIFYLRTGEKLWFIRKAHDAKITSLAFSDDDHYLLSGSHDERIKIFDMHLTNEVWWPGVSPNEVSYITLTSDDKFLLSGTWGGKFEIINIQTKDLVFKQQFDDPIWCISVSSDDKQFAFTDGDKIRLFNFETKQEICSLYQGVARTVTITKNNAYIISGGGDNSIRIYDYKTYQEVHNFENIHQDLVYVIALSKDEKYMFSGSKDRSIIVTDLATRQQVYHFKDIHEDNGIRTIAISRDNKFMISGSYDKSIKIFSIETMQEIHHIKDAHKSGIISVIVSNDNNYFISASLDDSIKIFQMQTKEELFYSPNIHKNWILTLAISSDDKYLFSGSYDGTIKRTLLQEKQQISSFGASLDFKACNMAVSKDNKYIIIGDPQGSVIVFDFDTKQKIYKFENSKDIMTLNISESSKYLITGFKGGAIKVFNLQKMKETQFIENAHEGNINSIAVSRDETFIFSASDDGLVKIFNLQQGKKVYTYENIHTDSINSICLTNSEKLIVTGSKDCSIGILDFVTRKKVRNIQNAHKDSITSIAVSRDDLYAISGSDDLSIKIWKIETLQLIQDFYMPDQSNFYSIERQIQISQDGKYMVFCSNISSIIVWDYELKQEIYRYEDCHDDWLTSMTISSDNKYILSASVDRTFKIFCLEGQLEGDRWAHGQDEGILYLGISYDDRYIVSGSKDGLIKLFDVQTKEEMCCFNHGGKICSVAMSSCSHYVVSRGDDMDCSIKVFDLKEKEEVFCFKNEELKAEGLGQVKISNNGQFIVSLSQSKPIMRLLELTTQKELWNKLCDEGKSICITSNNRYVLIGFNNGSIKTYNLQNGEELYSFTQNNDNLFSLSITNDGKYVIAHSKNTINIFDIETKQEIDNLKDIKADWFILSADDKYLLTKADKNSLDVWDLGMKRKLYQIQSYSKTTQAMTFSRNNDFVIIEEEGYFKTILTPFLDNNQMNFISSKISPIFTDNYVDIFLNLKDAASIQKFLSLYPDMYVASYNWTILHLLAIFHPSVIPPIRYTDFQGYVSIDENGKTPLHYLLAHPNVKVNQINNIVEYINNYLQDKSRSYYESKRICDSLANLLTFILAKTLPRLSKKFLNLCYRETLFQHGEPIPAFGEIDAGHYSHTFSKTYYMVPETLGKIYKKGSDQIMFRTNMLYLDYNPTSEDMIKIVAMLIEIQDIEIFRLPPIQNILEHLWDSTKTLNVTLAVAYSILMLLISSYIIISERTLLLAIPIIILAFIFLLIEINQAISLKEKYLKGVWNWLDIVSLMLMLTFIVTQLTESVHAITDAWIVAGVITFGFLRWLSYLRLFSSPRHLIETILVVLDDMRAFITMILMILAGFSLIFLRFSELKGYSGSYVDHFYDAYKLLFGNYDDSDFSFSQDVLVSLLLFILNVVLLNLLISIIGNSYGKVQDYKEMADAHARLEIVQDAIVLMRKLPARMTDKFGKGYLISCLPDEIEDDAEESSNFGHGSKKAKKNKVKGEKPNKATMETENNISGLKFEMNEQRKEMEELIDKQKNEIKEYISKQMDERINKQKLEIEELINKQKKDIIEELTKLLTNLNTKPNSQEKLTQEV